MLINLGISESCRLHGDFWHLINVVFLNTFHGYYTQLKPILQAMLQCKTEVEWNNCYMHCKVILSDNAELMSELTSIHLNPSYYSRWSNRKFFENLDYISSAPAEQNHSSICALFEVCGNLSIVEHVAALINRYVLQYTQRTEKAYNSKSIRKFYKSVYTGVLKEIDENARKVLGNYMYKKFKSVLYDNLTFDFEISDGLCYYHVYQPSYSIENRTECPYYQQIPVGGRCKCTFAYIMNAQCRHEVCIHRSFKIKLFSQRWQNNETYDRLSQNKEVLWDESKRLGTSQHICEVIKANNIQEEVNITAGVPDSSSIVGQVNAPSAHQGNSDACISNNTEQQSVDTDISKLSYNSVLDSCRDLLRLIKNDPVYMHSFQETIINCTERARDGCNINTFFGTNSIPGSNINNVNLKSVDSSYLPGVLGNCPNATNKKRLLTSGEVPKYYRPSNATGPKNNQISECSVSQSDLQNTNDNTNKTSDNVIDSHDNNAATRSSSDIVHICDRDKTKTCGMCNIAGHQRKKCDKMTRWNKQPVTDKEERRKIALQIGIPKFYHSILTNDNGTLNASTTLPKYNVRVIIIHAICIAQTTCNTTKKNLVLCTLLNNVGDVHEEYDRYWFHHECVSDWIIKGGNFKQKYLISFLNLNVDNTLSMSQPSI